MAPGGTAGVPPRSAWNDHAASLLKSLGNDPQKRRKALRRTIDALRRGGRRSRPASSAVAFYEYALEKDGGIILSSSHRSPSAMASKLRGAVTSRRHGKRDSTGRFIPRTGSEEEEEDDDDDDDAGAPAPEPRKRGRPPKRKRGRPPKSSTSSSGGKGRTAAKGDRRSSKGKKRKARHQEEYGSDEGSGAASGDESTSSESSMDEEKFLDQHNDLCEVCNTGGELLCCNTCNLVFHMGCSRPKLVKLPPDNWSCAYCVASGVTGYKREARERRRAAQAVREIARLQHEAKDGGGKADSGGGGDEKDANQAVLDAANAIERRKRQQLDAASSSGRSSTGGPNASSAPPSAKTGRGWDSDGRPDASNVKADLGGHSEGFLSDDGGNDSGSGRTTRRVRKQPTLFDPQLGAASEWQSDGAREWRYLEGGGEKKEASVESNDGDSSGVEQNQNVSNDPFMCEFCKDNDSIPVCCFCACRVCFSKHDKEHTLLCDSCDSEYHMFCLEPPLSNIPKASWFCPSCRASSKMKPKDAKKGSVTTKVVTGGPTESSTITGGSPAKRSKKAPVATAAQVESSSQSRTKGKSNPHTRSTSPVSIRTRRASPDSLPGSSGMMTRRAKSSGTSSTSTPPTTSAARSLRSSSKPKPRPAPAKKSVSGSGKAMKPKGMKSTPSSTPTSSASQKKALTRPSVVTQANAQPLDVAAGNASEEASSAQPPAKPKSTLIDIGIKSCLPTETAKSLNTVSQSGASVDTKASDERIAPKVDMKESAPLPSPPPALLPGSTQPSVSPMGTTTLAQSAALLPPSTTSNKRTSAGLSIPYSQENAESLMVGVAGEPKLTKNETGSAPGGRQILSVAPNSLGGENLLVTAKPSSYQSQRSRSGRIMKRNSFLDDIEEGEQHLRCPRYSMDHQKKSSPAADHSEASVSTASAQHKIVSTTEKNESQAVSSTPEVQEDDKAGTPDEAHVQKTSGIVDGHPFAAVKAPLSTPSPAARATTVVPKPSQVTSLSSSVPAVTSFKHASTQQAVAQRAPAVLAAQAIASSNGHAVGITNPPVKVPRRKPGARECMQISRRFGANVIPQKYMDTLLDYCKRGKVEHLIRMRERLDDHSRFLEAQLAGLEALVKEKGELSITVPPATEDPAEEASVSGGVIKAHSIH